MSRNFDEHWQCQTCFRHFSSDKELRQHIEAFQSRTQHLSSRLERLLSRMQDLIAEIQECSAHSSPKLSDEEDYGPSDASSPSSTDNLVNDGGDGHENGHEKLFCEHEECDGKPKTSFKTWKDLVRHYTIHVQCQESCGFCGIEIDRVRRYVTHFDSCKTRKEGERSHQFLLKERTAIQRRRILREKASEELKLKRLTIDNTSDDAVSPQETNSRKRAMEVADADPEYLHQSRKRRTAGETGGDATVAINPDMSYQATRIEDAARVVAPAHFETDVLIPTHLDKSTSLGSNDGRFSADGADFLRYSVGSGDTFMGNDYMGAFARAPLLFSHTMDGSSSYSGQYETTTHARAPLLCSHTMDGSPSISAGHQYDPTVVARAPLLASHTMDGSSTNYPVCHYEVPAQQARIPPVEHDAVGRRRSSTQLIDEGMTALYGTPQTIQNLVSGAGGYG
ncbi:hypothetical protein BKA65DRAFT_545852 [Rhexocercosporidium sp. MPI-PUGE-AT-0058]|nr:hypothetical protein BKA65DRAFT_545852 [Rhexocercosporidium sp. MPI-PUGE-AT-0058]